MDSLGSFQQAPAEGVVLGDMEEELFPLHLERIVVDRRVGHLHPVVEEIVRLAHVRIPHRLGRVHARLRPAVGQSGDRRAVRAVNLERHEVVSTHAHAP